MPNAVSTAISFSLINGHFVALVTVSNVQHDSGHWQGVDRDPDEYEQKKGGQLNPAELE